MTVKYFMGLSKIDLLKSKNYESLILRDSRVLEIQNVDEHWHFTF